MAGMAWQDLIRANGPALAFRLLSLMRRELGEVYPAALSSLHAAWVADDAADDELAVTCRLSAAVNIRAALDCGQIEEGKRLTVNVQLVDVLRRAGEWGRAGHLVSELLADPPAGFIGEILQFQTSLISRKDCSGYSCADVSSTG